MESKPYVVAFLMTHLRRATLVHGVPVHAYSIREAMETAFLELEAMFGPTALGFDIKVVSVRPDTPESRLALEIFMAQLKLSVQIFPNEARPS
jgi:hypothetical protein